jgi:anti-sigma regulatory factor (Ser/Thr protein kinase)
MVAQSAPDGAATDDTTETGPTAGVASPVTVPTVDAGRSVELRFTPQPEHVRTARLVAVALARRVGVEAGLLDEVRLAVGEACSRAVGLHQRHNPGEPVLVVLDSADPERFLITVADRVSGALPGQRNGDGPDEGDGGGIGVGGVGGGGVGDDLDDAEMGLAVLTGLVDDLDISSGPDGGAVRMGWPVKDR